MDKAQRRLHSGTPSTPSTPHAPHVSKASKASSASGAPGATSAPCPPSARPPLRTPPTRPGPAPPKPAPTPHAPQSPRSSPPASDLRAVDLNLLVVFAAMVERRSVTAAAESIGLSQPAMSAAVARLRVLFDDPLFVRAGVAMKPTPRALELAVPVQRVIDTVRHDILQRSFFDPATSERQFTLITPDIGEMHFLPALLSRLACVAPGVRLQTVSRPRQAAAEALEAGGAEMALGYFPDLHKAGFFQQKLFDNPHVCILRQGHPAAARLTLKAYLAAGHAVVRPEGREHVFEQTMQQRGLQRRVVVEMAHFMSLLPVIEASDLVATVPRDLADVCVRYGAVQIVAAPVKAPVIAVRQFWHQRLHKDAACVWLRRLVHGLFAPA